MLTGTAAGGIAMINALGNLGGTLMQTDIWVPEPEGPGPAAVKMITTAAAALVELLAYDIPADSLGPRLIDFEIFGRRPPDGDFDDQLASGLAESIEDAKAAAVTVVKQPRETWTVLPAGKPS